MAGAAIGGAILGGVMDATGNIIQHHWAQNDAAKAWKRQLWLMSNRYQLTVEDLKKAGLNPLLAVGGMSPGQATAPMASSPGNPLEGGAANAASLVQRAQEAKRRSKELDILESTAEKAYHDAGRAGVEWQLSENQLEVQAELIEMYKAQAEMYRSNAKDTDASALLKALQAPEAAANARIYGSDYGTMVKSLEKIKNMIPWPTLRIKGGGRLGGARPGGSRPFPRGGK